jgi:hypothetical protein
MTNKKQRISCLEFKKLNMNKTLFFACIASLILSCQQIPEVEQYGKHYQENNDFESLQKAVDLIEIGSDTAYVQKILGEPIDFGFDYRYLVDSTGPNGCVVGAVFHLTDGTVDNKWIDEICE